MTDDNEWDDGERAEANGSVEEIDYEAKVGYGQPPKHTRWKRGMKSPNPLGRPRKNLTRKYYVERIAGRTIKITDAGQPRDVSVLEGIILVVKAKAISGNAAASKCHDKLLGIFESEDEEPVRKGVLFAPEKLTVEEWNQKYAHYRDGEHDTAASSIAARSDTSHAGASDLTPDSASES